jgi:hypothetical protein
VKEKKSKVLKNPRNEKIGYNIYDDKNIESLMQYYKISNPDVLFEYIKKHRLTKNIDDEPLEQKSA